MKRRTALWVFAVVVGIGLAAWFYGEVKIDKCLDAGGAWDYQQKRCIFEKPK
jgi:hypothetical protein